MYRKTLILLIILSIIAGVSYLFYLNLDEVVLTYTPEDSVKAPLGLTLIGSFSVGVAITSLIFLIVITKYIFRMIISKCAQLP